MKETFFYPGDRVVFVLNPLVEAIVVEVPGNGNDNIRVRWFSDETYCDDWVRPFEIIRRGPGKKRKKKNEKQPPKCPAPKDSGAHAFN